MRRAPDIDAGALYAGAARGLVRLDRPGGAGPVDEDRVSAAGHGTVEGFGVMAGDLFHENWRHEQRADGLYVIIEEIGGLGALGPFPDAEAARIGFARYFLGLDLAPPSAPVLPKADDVPAASRRSDDRRFSDVEIAHASRRGTR